MISEMRGWSFDRQWKLHGYDGLYQCQMQTRGSKHPQTYWWHHLWMVLCLASLCLARRHDSLLLRNTCVTLSVAGATASSRHVLDNLFGKSLHWIWQLPRWMQRWQSTKCKIMCYPVPWRLFRPSVLTGQNHKSMSIFLAWFQDLSLGSLIERRKILSGWRLTYLLISDRGESDPKRVRPEITF